MRIRTPEERAKIKSLEPTEWPEDVRGGKYLRMLQRHAVELRNKTEPDAHGNRQLYLDDVFLAHLLAFFNPTIKSLRKVEDFSRSRQAQRHLKTPKIARSTLSDFHKLVDPALLQPIFLQLQRQAAKNNCLPAGLPETFTQVLAVDGSFFALAADVAWAVRHKSNNGKTRKSARLDVHLNVGSWLPEVIDMHGADASEAEGAVRHIVPGAIHIYDRGIFSFELVQAQIDAKAFFVHRLRNPGPRTPQLEILDERRLTKADVAAGVLADRHVRFVGSSHRAAPAAVLREVVLRSPNEPDGEIRLLTNLSDPGEVTPEIVGVLYRQRWQVELFFRWLKTFAHFEHLMSESRNGVLLSMYVAIIGTLLICLFTETRPSTYAYAMLSWVASGACTLDEIVPILAERHRQIEVDKASKAKRDAKRKAQQ
jgi:hypothetical protein